MAAIPSKEPTTAQVAAVTFGFYSDEEVRKLSVKEITVPQCYDALKNAQPGGPYDKALGPLEQHDSCVTCGLRYVACPGHFGRVELPVPVYNPLVFMSLFKLLRFTCLHCFKLRMKQTTVDIFAHKLELLAEGRLAEALAEAVPGRTAASKAMPGPGIDGDGDGKAGDMEEPSLKDQKAVAQLAAKLAALGGITVANPSPAAGGAPAAGKARGQRAKAPGLDPAAQTSLTIEATKAAIGAFFRQCSIAKGRCENCDAINPTLRRQGFSKIFQQPLSAKGAAENAKRNICLTSALAPAATTEMEALEGELAVQLAREAETRRQRRAAASDGAAAAGPRSGGKAGKKRTDSMEEDKEESGKEEDLEEPTGSLGQAVVARQAGLMGDADGDRTSAGRPRFMTVSEVREVMRRMWAANTAILARIYRPNAPDLAPPQLRGRAVRGTPHGEGFAEAYRMFFLSVLPVPPNRVRPPSRLGEVVYEHPFNTSLQKIMGLNLDIVSLNTAHKEAGAAAAAAPADSAAAVNRELLRQVDLGRSLRLWLELQGAVNALLDSSTAPESGTQGIRQMLEKKEGLFRKNMMGKRVNFAARSVISPDPFLSAGEIGVPPYFATRLSFPERVTPWNVEELRAMVLRGAHEHPGAVAVEDEQGRMVNLARLSLEKRETLAKQLAIKVGTGGGALAADGGVRRRAGGGIGGGGRGKIVYRHLRDGDLLLTNRQPTLHKPGLMAHRARVLKGERTIRMHYANCATFNADFDGDEINLHLPQDQYGRAEGYGIVHADEQYIVPTDGKPIRGLIQDHVVAGTLLTARDTFLPRAEAMQLLYACCSPTRPGLVDEADLALPPPALRKPRVLWTGKQVVTAVLAFLTRGMPPLALNAPTKTPADYWSRGGAVDLIWRQRHENFVFPKSADGELTVLSGELLTGVADKAVYAKFGLVHAVQELYGNALAGRLISAFSRLFTNYLQARGFTCGYDDLLLVPQAEAARKELLARAEGAAVAASARYVGVGLPPGFEDDKAGAFQRQQAAEQVQEALAARYRSGADAGPAHDAAVTGALHPLGSEVVKACLPRGQAKPFPVNCLSLMTVTGAKGSGVNFSQISALLGQQELEGRRVPRMASGKTLPCFTPFDPGARSGGFIADRFLTGLRPQEYYFHCMAGREGLVDTTVKTSRSGYLQRCLVKNLEALRVHYDATVRDDTDGSIVQFAYGEDGVDVLATPFLTQFSFLARNAARFAQRLDLPAAIAASKAARLEADEARAAKLSRLRQKRLERGRASKAASEPPLSALLPPTALGVTSEAFADSLAAFVRNNPDGVLTARGKRRREGGARAPDPRSPQGFAALAALKYLRALAAPGEAVGVLAAQSVGEPSTQMTLNTFHMAGRGEANVTLGIPRLRELFMTAARSIKTPVMTLPLRPGAMRSDAEALANRLRRLRLAEVLESLEVEERAAAESAGREHSRARAFRVRLRFAPPALYPPEANLTFAEVAQCVDTAFRPQLVRAVQKALRTAGAASAVSSVSSAGLDPEDCGGGGGGGPAKVGRDKDEEDENAEADPENREGKLAWAGGRGEMKSYEAGDKEDRAAAAAARSALRQRDGDLEEEEDVGAEATAAAAGEEGDDQQPQTPREGSGAGGRSGPGAAAAAGGSSCAEAPAAEARTSICEADFTAELALEVGLDAPRVLMLELAERVAAETLLRATLGIERCYVVEKAPGEAGPSLAVQTDGIHFPAAWEAADVVDAAQVTSNDVMAVWRVLGVEAARATLVREVRTVFGAYGIAVDPRHLGLIADYMMHQGGYRACSRAGIDCSRSPFLKISFETAAAFLTDATLHGARDDLASPASRIVLGRVVEVGTGAFGLGYNLAASGGGL
ncbi:hypothetical protein WJX81_003612 [Elliptochloris bilobata]|uniref:DNA-directed RNA polymerase subunit n=1 Tax=Elliptochloris bilobata TaxID=381761 RepID=A0AAW1SHT9_9CHLO